YLEGIISFKRAFLKLIIIFSSKQSAILFFSVSCCALCSTFNTEEDVVILQGVSISFLVC
ncbi:hypothetical protein, partial [Bacillus mojavensis]|uniref:hypothetical protein n=1 Tax=Bacillus mojavensis TaxID=72360 RepID=UPI002DBC4FA6